jgi:DNA-binding LacI/PurR family transcriptional regulator
MRQSKAPAQRRRRVTALDVAKRAGVSRSAVSRTLTEGASVSEATRSKVLQAAEELGYHRNALVRGMITRRSGIVGVVTGGLDNPFLAVAFERLSRRLQQEGLKTLVYSGHADSDLRFAMPSMIEYRVDGCIFLTNDISPHRAARYIGLDIPLVLAFSSGILGVSPAHQAVPLASVSVDSVEATRAIAHLMVERGCRRFAYLGGHPDSVSNVERRRGFEMGLADHHRTLTAEDNGNFVYEDSLGAARRLLSRPGRPDAIFCGNDLMAMAVMDVARSEFALRVPDDLAVAGFDDIQLAAGAAYSLTSVRQPISDVVNIAIDLLLDFIEHHDRPPVEIVVHSELIRRASTG